LFKEKLCPSALIDRVEFGLGRTHCALRSRTGFRCLFRRAISGGADLDKEGLGTSPFVELFFILHRTSLGEMNLGSQIQKPAGRPSVKRKHHKTTSTKVSKSMADQTLRSAHKFGKFKKMSHSGVSMTLFPLRIFWELKRF
jgi:hypothetical protein